MAVGGLGGCIPVIVIPNHARGVLPYADTLDYCSFAYLVTYDAVDSYKLASVLERLRAVTAAEVDVRVYAHPHLPYNPLTIIHHPSHAN